MFDSDDDLFDLDPEIESFLDDACKVYESNKSTCDTNANKRFKFEVELRRNDSLEDVSVTSPSSNRISFGNATFTGNKENQPSIYKKTSTVSKPCFSKDYNLANSPIPSFRNSLKKDPKSGLATPKRKFPGPAGLVLDPYEETAESELTLNIEKGLKSPNISKDVISTTFESIDYCKSNIWDKMIYDLRQEDNQGSCIINTINLSSITKKVPGKLIGPKIPILIIVLKSSINMLSNPKAEFIDKTGEIQGTLDRRVLKKYGDFLRPGSVLVLHQAFVLSPSSTAHHLNVTPNNLIQIYYSEKTCNDGTVHCVNLSKITSQDILNICADFNNSSSTFMCAADSNSKAPDLQSSHQIEDFKNSPCVASVQQQSDIKKFSTYNCDISQASHCSSMSNTTKEGEKDVLETVDEDIEALLKDIAEDEFFDI